ncbi:MAG TPA: YihY family inner membrane protein [Burkholderiaceae bacterium]|nr:YihY family inner membrane protein [Burkholderiaceae bacterium]
MSRLHIPDPGRTAASIGKWPKNIGKVLRFSARRAAEKELPQVAASLTFTTVLAIVPLLAIVLALFTAFPLFDEFRLALENFLTANLMPPTVSLNVMGYLSQFATQASRLTVIGFLFLLVTSLMLMATVEKAFNRIWHVTRRPPLRRRMLVYWAILSLGPVLAGASLWATSYVARKSFGHVTEISTSAGFALSLIPLVITGIGFAALFVGVPNRRIAWRDAFVGGFCTAIALSAMKTGFAYYLIRFPSYTVIYGTFATLPIFLLWIYLSWLAILFGAMITATLPLLRLRLWEESRQAGAPFIDAIKVLTLLRDARHGAPPGHGLRFLCQHLRMHQDELLSVLAALEHLGLVVVVQERNDERWVLACDPAQVDLGRVVDTLLIHRGQPGFAGNEPLADALCAALKQTHTIPLENALKRGSSHPDAGVMVQNNSSGNREAIQENNHA